MEKTYVLVNIYTNENIGVFDEYDIVAVSKDKERLIRKADEMLATDMRESSREGDEMLTSKDADPLSTNNDIVYLAGCAEPSGFEPGGFICYHNIYAVISAEEA